MKNQLLALIIFITLSITGCTTYKLEIQQGNVVSEQDIAKLRIGMSKDQVKSLLGTPLLQDDFQQGRWDYTFTLKQGGKDVERKDLVLIFKNNSLTQIKK